MDSLPLVFFQEAVIIWTDDISRLFITVRQGKRSEALGIICDVAVTLFYRPASLVA